MYFKTVGRMDEVQEVQVSREAGMPGATAAVERTGMYLQRVLKYIYLSRPAYYR